jgi:sorting nexin-5/6/32
MKKCFEKNFFFIFRNDTNLAIFLEYEKELNVRGKNKKEKLVGFFSSFQKSGDELLLSNTLKDVDEFFEKERHFLLDYHANLKDCTVKADRMTSTHKSLADTFIKISSALVELSTFDSKVISISFFIVVEASGSVLIPSRIKKIR